MAPPHGDESTHRRPITNVLFIIAMQTEALPLVNKFQLAEVADSLFPKGVPWLRYSGKYKDLHINIVCPGKDAALGVDSVGTVSASLLAYASIQALQPDLVINVGTAGGFKWSHPPSDTLVSASSHEVLVTCDNKEFFNLLIEHLYLGRFNEVKGASIGDVFLASDVAFHDRRIPIPVFDLYGVGSRKTFSTPNLSEELNLKAGKLSTGDSLDMCPQDEAVIVANDATIKDMEGAAIAYVADLLNVPAIFLKAVTDIVDGDKPTAEEFLQNLNSVVLALDLAATKVVDFINGKCCTEL